MTTSHDRASLKVADRARRILAADIEQALADAGLSRRALANAAGIDPGFLGRILGGRVRPSLETYARLAAPLSMDLSTRLYPNTGPTIRDRHQAPMLELLLGAAHPRWRRFVEIGVRRPSRGWIDLGLHDPAAQVFVAGELESGLHRLEQLIRWQAMKAESLPSWEGWAHLGDEPAISRLLVVRRTRATRAVAREFGRQLRVAYPAHPDDAIASLTGTAPWPGPALVWAVLDGRRSRLAPGR
jgi:transcriptional regulator with XRE-family HTH domain